MGCFRVCASDRYDRGGEKEKGREGREERGRRGQDMKVRRCMAPLDIKWLAPYEIHLGIVNIFCSCTYIQICYVVLYAEHL